MPTEPAALTFWDTISSEASKWPREKSLKKFKDTIRSRRNATTDKACEASSPS